MKNFTKILMDKVNENASGGTPPETPPKPPAEQPPAADTPPPKEEGAGDDHNFGYEKTPPEGQPPKEEGKAPEAGDPPPKTPIEKIADIKEPGTGYGEEPPKVEDAPPVVPPKVDPPPAADDYDKVLVDLPKEDAAEIKAFVTENKIPAEVAKKWADKVKLNIEAAKVDAANMERQAEQQKNLQRKKWHDELKADPDFGGEKFQANVVRAEKVLGEFMPETKKFLTERKSMLPPYVMRDLAKMSAHLYQTDKLNPGEPPVKPEEEKVVDRVKDFYS